MKKYAVSINFYKKTGRVYENDITMSFVVANNRLEAFKKAIEFGLTAECVNNGMKVSHWIATPIPEQYLTKLLKSEIG